LSGRPRVLREGDERVEAANLEEEEGEDEPKDEPNDDDRDAVEEVDDNVLDGDRAPVAPLLFLDCRPLAFKGDIEVIPMDGRVEALFPPAFPYCGGILAALMLVMPQRSCRSA